MVAFLLAAAAAPRAGTALVISVPGPPPDAIVSLASHEWERLPAVVAQAAAYPKALVVLTVPKEVTIYNCHDCAHRPELLIAAGVHVSRIRQVPLTAPGTYGEALALKTFMREYNLNHLMVVTSPYHTRRSLATFRTVFADTPITIGVVPATATSPAQPQSWWWSGYDRAYVRYEWAAIVYYRVRYGVTLPDTETSR
jgi:uncharacterized SAM-binding protein YcdF (DUF218 family)